MSASDLILHKKVEDLFYRVYPTFRNFPKAEKQGLCLQIKMHFVDLLKQISLANSVRSKRLTFLQEADGTLENLTVLLRLSRNMKYISLGFFGLVDTALSEIKALLIGYLKSAIKPRASQFSAS